jgi:hypothetical protein
VQKVRKRVAPSLDPSFETSYRQLISQQQVASLRQAFNSRPLRIEAGGSLLQVLVDGGADSERVSAFYSNLSNVQDASESLFRDLADAASKNSDNRQAIAHYRREVKLAVETLKNRSAIAHLSGLMVLDSLDNQHPDTA